MSSDELAVLRDGERHTLLEQVSSQLRQNGMEDYRTHVQYTEVMYDGVSCFVHSLFRYETCVLPHDQFVIK